MMTKRLRGFSSSNLSTFARPRCIRIAMCRRPVTSMSGWRAMHRMLRIARISLDAGCVGPRDSRAGRP